MTSRARGLQTHKICTSCLQDLYGYSGFRRLGYSKHVSYVYIASKTPYDKNCFKRLSDTGIDSKRSTKPMVKVTSST